MMQQLICIINNAYAQYFKENTKIKNSKLFFKKCEITIKSISNFSVIKVLCAHELPYKVLQCKPGAP